MIGKGLIRGADGILEWHGGRRYDDLGEAVKTWCAGELRLGCNERVFRDYSSFPCGKTPKHDPDAHGRMTKCGVHCAAATDRRKAKQAERRAAWEAALEREIALSNAVAALEPALRRIAEGHNNPRDLAQEVIAALDAARGQA